MEHLKKSQRSWKAFESSLLAFQLSIVARDFAKAEKHRLEAVSALECYLDGLADCYKAITCG
jgi:hypothetical protein